MTFVRGLTAFVTDGDERPALAMTRSLGRRGVSVIVGAERRDSLAAASRHCARSVVYPSPSRAPDAFAVFLEDFVAHERVDAVMPVTDVTTHIVARRRDTLVAHTAVVAPAFTAFEQVTDKVALLQRAARCGVPIPRTRFVDGIAGLDAVIRGVCYPAVVKPAKSRILTSNGWANTSVHYARCESDLRHLYRTTDCLRRHPSMIQERIVGPGLGIFVLCDRGQVRAAFAHRRLREKPPSGGVSVLCESIAVDPALLTQAERLLGPLGWHGVAMLEYKQDRRTGTPFLMEVNGRFWGSLQLAIDAGVDFPYLAWQLTHGAPPQTVPSYEVGVRSRWLLGDLDHLLRRVRPRDPDLPDDARPRMQTLRGFLFPGPRVRNEVARRDDLRPALRELRDYAAALRLPARLRRYIPRLHPQGRLRTAVLSRAHEKGSEVAGI
jgi:predicted ATP-grasp superfamily ATP-dependent carboligase